MVLKKDKQMLNKGAKSWKELTNPKREREIRFTVSEKEWQPSPEETYLKEEETKDVRNFLTDKSNWYTDWNVKAISTSFF